MTVFAARYEQEGEANQPSPSLWRDCRMGLLNDLGLGKYAAFDGTGMTTGVAGAGVERRPHRADHRIRDPGTRPRQGLASATRGRHRNAVAQSLLNTRTSDEVTSVTVMVNVSSR